MDRKDLSQISYDIIGAALEVRNVCDKYFREQYYKEALSYELTLKGHQVEKEVILPAAYKGVIIDNAYRMDLLVDQSVIIELKALQYVGSREFRQILSYLKLSGLPMGFLINFGCEVFKLASNNDIFSQECGIYRFVNTAF